MKFKEGDIVKSKINTWANAKYKIIKCKKSVCWLELIDKPMNWMYKKLPVYKNIKYATIYKEK